MVVNMPQVEGNERILRQARVATAVAAPRGSNSRDLESWSSDRSFVMSFARGLSVIHAFANQSHSLTIAEISRRTKIPRAAVRRLLHTLQELGYVRQDDAEYALTPVVLLLGHSFLSSSNLAVWAQPIVSRLSNELDAFCLLSVRDGDDTMMLAVSNLHSNLDQRARNMNVGSRAPLYCGSSGLLFLSAMSEKEREDYFSRATLRPFTHRTPTELNELRQLIRKAGEQRYAVVDRALSMEHRSVAVPVLDRIGNPVAALVAVVNTDLYSVNDLISKVLPRLSASARELSAHMV